METSIQSFKSINYWHYKDNLLFDIDVDAYSFPVDAHLDNSIFFANPDNLHFPTEEGITDWFSLETLLRTFAE